MILVSSDDLNKSAVLVVGLGDVDRPLYESLKESGKSSRKP